MEPRLTMLLVKRLEAEALAIDELEELGVELTPAMRAFRDASRSFLVELDTAVVSLKERSAEGA